jgi:hypothetical protein
MDENTRIKTLIQKRKLCNMLLAATNLAMMGADIANCYFHEEGPFSQKMLMRNDLNLFRDPNAYQSCECPSGERSCKIQMSNYMYDCRPTLFNVMGDGLLDMISYGTTLSRLSLCGTNLYNLYQVQQVLNGQAITEHEDADNRQEVPSWWVRTQGLSAAVTGIIVGAAGIGRMNGFANYPRTLTIWGLNSVVDFLGAINSYGNEKAYEQVIAHHKNK